MARYFKAFEGAQVPVRKISATFGGEGDEVTSSKPVAMRCIPGPVVQLLLTANQKNREKFNKKLRKASLME